MGQSSLRFTHTGGGFDRVIADEAEILVQRLNPNHIWLAIKTADGKTLNVDLRTKGIITPVIKATIANNGFSRTGTPSERVDYTETTNPALSSLFEAVDGKPQAPEKEMSRHTARKLGVGLLFSTVGFSASIFYALLGGKGGFVPAFAFIGLFAAIVIYIYFEMNRAFTAAKNIS